ncbi:spore germination protein [Brevibacillus daliensis]|uniref:spore germination protein n=1 Tax=Brevibacillus daliensis TaxID=2892995 RepID=UPI001E606884|nr:spore germination protein [Brevibacillus daliensis]
MANRAKDKRPISIDINENNEYLKEKLGIGKTFDIGIHEFRVSRIKVALYYINGFADNSVLTLILQDLNNIKDRNAGEHNLERFYQKFIPFYQISKIKTCNEFIDKILVGQVGLIIDGEDTALMMDAKIYLTRSPDEPETEGVVRGAHDGFTEALINNTSLTRRRIRDERLRFEIMQIGERSKTDVVIAYIHDIANPELIEVLRNNLQDIQIDGIPMTEKMVEEFLMKKWNWHPFPLVRYTERPDVAAVHLFEGHVLIYVDTSPSVIITPSTYFHHVQHAEEYRQTPIIGAYLRWVRYFGIMASLLIAPMWLLLVTHPEYIPPFMDFIGTKDTGKVPLTMQFLMAELGIDLMRMASIHTPRAVAVSMGLIAAILIGEIAIKVGLFSPEVILYISISAIGTYTTPSYELSLANRLVRIVFIVLVGLFGLPGFMLGGLAVLILLALTRSLDTPYLWPLFPFNYEGLKQIILRQSVTQNTKRPKIVRIQNPKRM